MNEGPIWVWSTIRTSRNQNASSWEDFKQQVRLNLCDCGNTQASNPGVNRRNGDGPHGNHTLQIQ